MKTAGWGTWTPNKHRGFPRNADASKHPQDSEWTSDLAHATKKMTNPQDTYNMVPADRSAGARKGFCAVRWC
jgi:hypothetical protein